MKQEPVHSVLPEHLRQLGVHRASQQAELPALSTGWPSLDRLLPGGGYPVGAVTELLCASPGLGEFSLLLQALTPRLAARPQAQLALVSPRANVNAPALIQAGVDSARLPLIYARNDDERVWCIEQMAATRAFVGFVVWSDNLDTRALRRLQLAAEKACCPLFVYRDIYCAGQRSPAALRLTITARANRQHIEVLKCRGPAGARTPGLQMTRNGVWRWSDHQSGVLDSVPAAQNETFPHSSDRETDFHVARPAFSPLGAR